MLFSSIILIFFLSHPLFADVLNIYKNVAEVQLNQTGAGTYDHVFKSGEYANIVDGSITWSGTPFIKQDIYNGINTLKGASVTIRQSSVCECKSIEAKIIDPNTMLVQNIHTGVYFYADSRSIEYKSQIPSTGETILKIEFKDNKTKYNGTLAYLTKGITWIPNYDLFVTNADTCNLQGVAVIHNNLQQEYEIDSTYLYSDDLQLVNTNPTPVAIHPLMLLSAQSSANSQSIQYVGEDKGFYFYSLKTKYTLYPASYIRLPFVDFNPKCQFYYKATTYVSNGQYQGVFQRTYNLTSNQFLPAGILTVRNNQILLGQANLPDVLKNRTQTVSLGPDNNVQYSINGNLTASVNKNGTLVSQTYTLDVTISNYENKSVKGHLGFSSGVPITVNKSTCNSAKDNGYTIDLPFEIKQSGNYQCQLIVTLKYA